MQAIFLPGPFADADMLGAILGTDASPAPVPARVAGHALAAEPGAARLGLVPAPEAEVAGARVEAEGEALDRLAFALAAFGQGARAVEVRLAGGGGARALVSDASWPPLAATPGAEWRAHLVEAARELMGWFGRATAAEASGLMLGVSYRALARTRGARECAPVIARAGFGLAEVAPVGLDRPYARYFAIEAHRLRHRRFDGAISPVIERAVFVSGDAVTVLPFDPVRRAVLLIEQFRVGPLARRDPHPWCLEAVAGRCDAGEDPEATARREAREEAGLDLGRIERMLAYYSSPGIAAEHITAFVGEADLGAAGGIHGLASEDEDIRAHVLPLAEAMALAAAGEVNNAPLLLSLLWLEREADRLVAAWTGAGAGR